MSQARLEEPRLAHARLAGQQHNPTGGVLGRGKHLIQRSLFVFAPNQIIVVDHGASSCR